MIQQARGWLAVRLVRVGRQMLPSLALLLILFGSLVYGVSDTVQGIERGPLWPLVWAGLPVGWLLANRRIRGWIAAFIALLSGIVLLLLSAGRLGDPLFALASETASLVWQVVQGVAGPSTAPIQAAWATLGGDATALVTRLYTWALSLVQGQPLFDPVPIALLWGLALWCTAVWASWAVRRSLDIVWAVAPATGLLAIALAYVGGRAWYLLPVLVSILVLKALAEYETRRQHWQQDSVRYPRRVRSHTLWLALGLSLTLALVAAITPSISVASLVELARDLTGSHPAEEEVASSLGLEPQTASGSAETTMLDARRSTGLPTRHLIGSGPELSEQVALVISIESAPAGTASGPADQIGPYYWRSLTYERYTGRGWSAAYAGRVRYNAGETAVEPVGARRQWLRARVRRVGDSTALLYVAGTVLTADREFRIAWRSQPNEEEPGDLYGVLVDAGAYRVDSLLPVVNEADLRTSGQEYPEWILDRYLALPDSIPDRVLALARDLTATELTPYDRAIAIERYLRRFPYTLDIPSPPTDRDLVDYFLFDLRRGYCDYYATAMVVLARAAGLPARLVTGYATGTYDEAQERYVVTEAEAHAWAEIYFPGYGWSEFEPTAGRPAIERPAEALPQVPAEPETPPEPITAQRSRARWALWLGIFSGLVALSLVSAALWLAVDGWRLRHLSPRSAVVHLYRRLYRYEHWLEISPPQGATPGEIAAALGRRLQNLAGDRHWGALLASAPSEIGWLSDLCTRALYSAHRPDETDQEEAIRKWSQLRRRLWVARLLSVAPW